MKTLLLFVWTCVLLNAGSRASAQMFTPIPNTITVTGVGTYSVPVERAVVLVTVNSKGTTASEVFATAEKTFRAIRDAVGRHGVKESQIVQRANILYPIYDYSVPAGTQPKLTGYNINRSYAVDVTKLDMLAKVMDAAGEAGGSNLQIESYGVNGDDTPVEHRAEQEALRDAARKVERLAKELKVKVGEIVAVIENEQAESEGGGGEEERERRSPLPDPTSHTRNSTMIVTYSIKK